MAKTEPFERHYKRYEEWFSRHEAAYHSELFALRALLPWEGLGLEIGVGSGRFAAPLGISIGIDPSRAMLRYAAERGIRVVEGVAESLPFREDVFDYALVVTTICFVDDPAQMFSEARRVLRSAGALCVGFIDRESRLGRFYLSHQQENVFYRDAKFYSSAEVESLLSRTGFRSTHWVQTLFHSLEDTHEIEPLRDGRGAGAFVVVRADKA